MVEGAARLVYAGVATGPGGRRAEEHEHGESGTGDGDAEMPVGNPPHAASMAAS